MIPAAPPAIMWQHPGRAPYMGTFDQAVAAFAIPPPPRPLQCHYRDVLAGERFAAMMFGRDLVAYNVVADTGSWPAADTRVAEDCWFIASGSEYHLVKPLVCGNWALEVLPIAGWWPGDAPAGGWYGGAKYGGGGEEEWSAGGYGSGGYGLPGGYGVPVSYEVPSAVGTAAWTPSAIASGFAGIPGSGSSEYPSGAGGSGAGGRVAVPEPPGIFVLMSALTGLMFSIPSGRRSLTRSRNHRRSDLETVDGAGSSSETNARQTSGGGRDGGERPATYLALGLLAMLGMRRRDVLPRPTQAPLPLGDAP